MTDIRDVLFQEIAEKRYQAVVKAERSGVLAGSSAARACAERIGIRLEFCRQEGEEISHGQCLCKFTGTPKQIALAEEQLIGTMAKASGIATAARDAVLLADRKVKIVAGAWKKMPPEIKQVVRSAIESGGAVFRICQPPMIYLDKNFIRMFGSISNTLKACRNLPESTIIVQIRGDGASVEEEVREAASGGCGIFMVDTGDTDDLRRCIEELEKIGLRKSVQVAFAGNVTKTRIPELVKLGADILCIGREIVDAPLLDMKLDVVREER